MNKDGLLIMLYMKLYSYANSHKTILFSATTLAFVSYTLGINDLNLIHYTQDPKIVIKYRSWMNRSDLFLVNKFRNSNIGQLLS